MKKNSQLTLFLALIAISFSSTALWASHHKVKPVTVGSGIMTFKTVPGWGLDADGKSVLGRTHGSIVIDREGNVYTSAEVGVFVFSSDGKLVRSFLDDAHSKIHDMEIREEDGVEYIYGARNKAAEIIKFKAIDGTVVLSIGFPKESGVTLPKKGLSPTAVTVADNGDIYMADGYSSNIIFKFNKAGKYLSHFGTDDKGVNYIQTAHGMTLDKRYTPHRLLVCDRNRKPGRLVHFSLDGKYIQEVISDLRMPTAVAIQGDYVVSPDLKGRVIILDKNNKLIAVLGDNPDEKKWANFKITQDQWEEGVFTAPHGAYWDKDGNLYVQDWNIDGRITKLVRVRK